MNIQYQYPGDIPKPRLPDQANDTSHRAVQFSPRSVSPLRGAVLCVIALFGAGVANAAPIACYTPDNDFLRTSRNCVNPSDIPNFVTRLPIPGAMTATPKGTGKTPDTMTFKVTMRQGLQQMLPLVNATGGSTGFTESTIWGYADQTKDDPTAKNPDKSPVNPTLHAPGFAVIVNKNTPAEVTYDSIYLPTAHPLVDSQDWGMASSMPFNGGFVNDPIFLTLPAGPGAGLNNRVSVHTHGLADSYTTDGGPWDFFPNHLPLTPSNNHITYTYPNAQNCALYWFHDHAMGQTRLNVYLGLAAPYIIRDSAHPIDGMLLKPAGTKGALDSAFELPLVIQDRDFTDTDSMTGLNEQYYEEAPSGPERFGSVWMVNGATTPYVDVTNHVYLLRLLNGSQARVATLKLHIEKNDTITKHQTIKWKPALYVIGHEQGADPTLTRAVQSVTIAPGERLDVLVDFRLAGKESSGDFKFLLVNTAPAPFPGGAGVGVPPCVQPLASSGLPNNCIPQADWHYDENGLPNRIATPTSKIATPISQVMEFRLTRDTAGATALDDWMPVADGKITAKKINPDPQTLLAQTLSKYCGDVPAGTVCDYKYLITPDSTGRAKLKERVFTLYDLPFANQMLGPMDLNTASTGELRYGVNIDNVHYTDPGSVNIRLPSQAIQNTMLAPAGSDVAEEVWTFVNATPDAHPMHEHLFAVQALDREYFDSMKFLNDSLGYPSIDTPLISADDLSGARSPTQPAWGGIVGGVNNGVPGGKDFHDYVAKDAAGGACGSYGDTVPAATATCIAASTAAANNKTAFIVTSGDPLTPAAPAPLAPEERNWKDVIVAMPGQITRILVRTARPEGTSFMAMPKAYSTATKNNAGDWVLPISANSPRTSPQIVNPALLFNTKLGTFPMHCHILEHEENDMMTSFNVQ